MTIKKAFIKYMDEVLNLGTATGANKNIFKDAAPQKAPDDCWWVTGGGGPITLDADTGEKRKEYLLSVYYRSIDSDELDEILHAFETRLNGKHCDQLDSFDTIDMRATNFQSDQDLDNEDRSVGLVQVTVSVFQHE